MVGHLRIEEDDNGVLLAKIDTFSGVLREYFIREVVHFSDTKNGLVEVFTRFRNEKKHQDMWSTFSVGVRDVIAHRLETFVRVNFFEKVNSISEKIPLEGFLYEYYMSKSNRKPKAEENNLAKDSSFASHVLMNQLKGGGGGGGTINDRTPRKEPPPFESTNFLHPDLIQVSLLIIHKLRTSIATNQPSLPFKLP